MKYTVVIGSDGKRDVVWGIGKSEEEAFEDAGGYTGCPPKGELRVRECDATTAQRIKDDFEIDAEALGLA